MANGDDVLQDDSVTAEDLPLKHDQHVSPWAVVGVLLAIFVTYALFADASSLWDRDEPRFARSAYEMLTGGDWLVPDFNGDFRLHKPVFVYWLMAIGIKFIGFSELAVRMPSVLGITLSSLMVFFIGKRLFHSRVGLLAMCIFPTMLLPLVIGSAATADGTLLGFIVLSTWLIIEILYRSRWWMYLLLGLALGGAQLTKGPVGLIPVLTFIGIMIAGRDGIATITKGKVFGIFVAVLIAIAMFLAWGIPANIATGGQFLNEGVGKHVVGRSVEAMESHGGSGLVGYLVSLPVYIPVLIVGVSPWVLFLPLGISGQMRGYIGSPKARAVLWGWMVPTFILMSLVATKLPHYILPIFPAVALMIAAAIYARAHEASPDDENGWLATGLWVFIPFMSLAALGGLVAPWLVTRGMIGFSYLLNLLFVAIMILLIILITRQVIKRQLIHASVLVTLILPLVTLPTYYLMMPGVNEEFKPSKTIAQGIHEIIGEDVPVVMSGYEEPSLVFYLKRPAGEVVEESGASPEKVYDWSRSGTPGVLIITAENLKKVEDKFGPLRLHELFRDETINYSAKGRQLDILVMGRGMTSSMLNRATAYREHHGQS
ncbi:ArnT family glycosyltransferase [Poriferisphaera sp. WC338]|uniref:ArnT family glycosyltransferase n=1 Tax=Poriferisphaera sp. WC338 TaxID=3425129 RepID=UPI003D81B34A